MLYKLKELRNEHHISQQTLGEIIGVSQQSINKYENNNIEPDISTLIKIADYFDISVDYLIGHTNIKLLFTDSVKNYTDSELVLLKLFNRLSEKNKTLLLALLEELTK